MSTATNICPVCGGLECLCRPRFFAGQLLTDEDLNRLDAYIRGKQRLHNRSLHGWGVVNGLDVRCEPCEHGGVVVTPGHALAPCGEDIVVCEPAAVDVCALIRQCEPPGEDPCLQPPAAEEDCDDEQEWALSICYREYPTRGVVPLRPTGSACACGKPSCECGCGGSGGCGCGAAGGHAHSHAHPAGAHAGGTHSRTSGNGNGNGAYPGLGARSRAALECEPTVVCESFYFGVRRVRPEYDRGERDPRPGGGIRPRGSLAGGRYERHDPYGRGGPGERFERCAEELRRRIPPAPEDDASREELHRWCCDTRAGLLDYIRHGAVYDCTLGERLAQVHCPRPPADDSEQDAFDAAMETAREELERAVEELLYACSCHALQPPAPESVADNCVTIATVRVRRRDCRVLSVCNWTPLRKYVLSAPAVEHWASQVPVLAAMRERVYRRCCGDRRYKYPYEPAPPAEGEEPQPFGEIMLVEHHVIAREAEDAPSRERARMTVDDSLSEEAARNPLGFLLAEEIGRPLEAFVEGFRRRSRR